MQLVTIYNVTQTLTSLEHVYRAKKLIRSEQCDKPEEETISRYFLLACYHVLCKDYAISVVLNFKPSTIPNDFGFIVAACIDSDSFWSEDSVRELDQLRLETYKKIIRESKQMSVVFKHISELSNHAEDELILFFYHDALCILQTTRD